MRPERVGWWAVPGRCPLRRRHPIPGGWPGAAVQQPAGRGGVRAPAHNRVRCPAATRYIADDAEHLPSRLVERAELERVLAEAIEQMPAIDRTVISLYYQEELTLREIAEIVHLHQSRISQLKSQAILRLRTYLARRWPTERGL